MFTILYLEDDLSLGAITSETLQRSGFEVIWIRNGKQALTLVESKKISLCIVDIMMPGLDGYSFVKSLRVIHNTLPVIFLSARTLTEDIVKGFQAGGNDYLKKPFSMEELIVRIEALLKRNTEALRPQDELTIGRYIFRYRLMQLQFEEEEPTMLSDRANELLFLLASKKNEVVERKSTLLKLWGDDTFFNARSMDVFITQLRKKLCKDTSIGIINVRGTGYKLITP